MSENFNDFFVNVGHNLAKHIPNVDIFSRNYMRDRVLQTIFIEPVTAAELIKIVHSLKNGAPGYDGVPSQILKETINTIINPLCFLCNHSLEQGVFSSELKLANMLPLFKSGDSMLFNNYRPASLLCTLSKDFEKVMHSRFHSFFQEQNILINNQFRFKRLHSSSMALMFMMDKITNATDNGDYVIGIFFDFSKAFDTVKHGILLEKLCHYGIRGHALDWFRTYLSNRKQFVTSNGTVSSTKTITYYPKGPFLGPYCLYIYIYQLVPGPEQISVPSGWTKLGNVFHVHICPVYYLSHDRPLDLAAFM